MQLRHGLVSLVAGSLLSAGAGCNATPLPEMVENLNSTLAIDPFAVKPGDRISVQFPNNPEFNQIARVRPDGTVSLQFIDRLEVEGLTLEDVETRVIEAYTETLKVPELTVDIPDLTRRNVLVIGEIRSPGPVSFSERDLSLVEALALSGGPDWQDGRLGKIVLFRWFTAEQKRRAFLLDASLEYWGNEEQIWLQPDDIIYIPPKPVVVLGNWIDQYIRRLLPIPYVIPGRVIGY